MRTRAPSGSRESATQSCAASGRILAAALCTAIGGLLAACADTPPMPPAIPTAANGPAMTTIDLVQRDWHTDICVSSEDMDASLAVLTEGFDGARFLCFGFGERQYVVERRHDPLTMLSALLPSQAALLMTVLRASPEEAFGTPDVVHLAIGAAGRDGLQSYLRASLRTDTAGHPVRLGAGPYPGRVFYAATGTYDAFHTCNTWTARGLRSAGLPIDDAVLFAGAVMRQARHSSAALPLAPSGASSVPHLKPCVCTAKTPGPSKAPDCTPEPAL
ncbi:DUF2459 domain-containing protein [Paraburkholderia pallida]|uniref:DUF2459 domain-containing protein n=2 Tax=Paraburkholderia pallida TaxID=2547399 RepID=A0A4P7D8R2_9BURK|nr:DUF2459 domain-containing protein [Paraburkholderia pallida]